MSLSALLLAIAAAQDPLVFSVRTERVRLEVLVLREGRPVRGLEGSAFEVRDDGVVQSLGPILEDELPVDVTLVLDTSASTAGETLSALRDAAASFVAGLRGGENAALLDFRDEVRLLAWPTPQHAAILKVLAGLEARGNTALRDAVYAGIRLQRSGARRSAVVVFSDGVDSMSWLDTAAVVQAARRGDAVVYAVAARDRSDPHAAFLSLVARATGGRLWTVRPGDDLRERFLDVLADIRSRYVLSFAPTSDRPGWHDLEIRLRDGAEGEVLARPTYWRAATE